MNTNLSKANVELSRSIPAISQKQYHINKIGTYRRFNWTQNVFNWSFNSSL